MMRPAKVTVYAAPMRRRWRNICAIMTLDMDNSLLVMGTLLLGQSKRYPEISQPHAAGLHGAVEKSGTDAGYCGHKREGATALGVNTAHEGRAKMYTDL